MKNIYVVTQPRSGTTWLVRLLSDALASGMVAHNREGIDEPLFAGQRTDGDYLIRKAHYAQEYDGTVVFLQRDPRDVAVSRMHYRKMTDLSAVIKTMFTYEPWMQKMASHGWTVQTTYERLHKHKFGELERIMYKLVGDSNFTFEIDLFQRVFERQHIDNVRTEHPHSARKGIVGDWKNHFTRSHGEQLTELLGDFMLAQNYISNLDWWKELDK